MNKFNFWAWLYRKSKYNVKKYNSDADIRCSNCQQWHSELLALKLDMKIEDTVFGFIYTCGCCGNVSHWNTLAAPVALQCDSDGTPYKAQQAN